MARATRIAAEDAHAGGHRTLADARAEQADDRRDRAASSELEGAEVRVGGSRELVATPWGDNGVGDLAARRLHPAKQVPIHGKFETHEEVLQTPASSPSDGAANDTE